MADQDYHARIDQLIAVGATAVQQQLALASGGNLSVRGPEPGLFTVTCSGSFLDTLTRAQLTVMNLDGDVVSGPTPSSEWRLHQLTYRARPDVEAIVHLHPEYAMVLDALALPIRQITLDHVAYASDIRSVPFFPNGSVELAEAAAGAAADTNCVILGRHGCMTLSTTPQDALRKALNLESAARATYRLVLAGDTDTEFPQDLRATALHG